MEKFPDVVGHLLSGKTAYSDTILVPATAKGGREGNETDSNLLPNMKVEVAVRAAATVADTGAVQVKERLGTAPDSAIRQR
jgi:hypothetical protein